MTVTYRYVKDMATGVVSKSVVRRLPDKAFVPIDADNEDGAAYLAWLAEGNEPEPAE